MEVVESIEQKFKAVEFQFIRRFKKKPSLEAILLMIGFQESPESKQTRDKEEKLDLINLGVLIVLEKLGYFQKIVSDSNWPAFEPTDKRSEENKELIIKKGIVEYFKDYTW